jgi:hypothetical protein
MSKPQNHLMQFSIEMKNEGNGHLSVIYALLLILPSTIIHNNIIYRILKINNERHRSFHFCRAVLSTHFFFYNYEIRV